MDKSETIDTPATQIAPADDSDIDDRCGVVHEEWPWARHTTHYRVERQ